MTVIIERIEPSNRKGKKYTAILSDGKQIHFGLAGSNTYVDGASTQMRNAYLARHLANKTEQQLIQNLVLSPALLSAYILWNTPDIDNNVKILNKMLKNRN